MRLLLIEDHADLAVWVAKTLRHSGFVVDVIARGDHAATALCTQTYDLVILDLSLPGMDGLEILRRVRSQERTVHLPVLILTARGAPEDRVKGLNLGADDYLPKPFEVAELEARIKALLRRSNKLAPVVQVGGLAFDITNRVAAVHDRPLSLTQRELAVLEALLSRQGKPVSREALFAKVFGIDDDVNPEAIELYVHRLRRKLEGSGAAITTMRGLGYVLSAQSGGVG
ncbi:response regulator [Propionivibrio sp.]|jgi:two-component system response regulator TctD|uniref:response regulator n=1 Tax=Propionivibrio sp. TaxID=2212460 RepID=UPI0039E4E6DE